MRLREAKRFAQRHTAGERQRSELNPTRIQEAFEGRPDLAMGAEGAKAWRRAQLAVFVAQVGEQVGGWGQSKNKKDLKGHLT